MSPMQQYLLIMMRGHLARSRSDERGVSAVEWILITLALIGIALAVGVTIRSAITSKADTISL